MDAPRTIAALAEVVGADPVIGRSAEDRAAAARDLVGVFEESTGDERAGLEAMFGAVDRMVDGRPFADAELPARRAGLRRALFARAEHRELVVRSVDVVLAAFQTLNDPMAGRYIGMYPLPSFITAG